MIEVNRLFTKYLEVQDGIDPIAHPQLARSSNIMAHNALLPTGRTTPIPAFYALREKGVFANVLRVRAVSANNPAGPRNTAGVSTAKLGGPNGITLQVTPHF